MHGYPQCGDLAILLILMATVRLQRVVEGVVDWENRRLLMNLDVEVNLEEREGGTSNCKVEIWECSVEPARGFASRALGCCVCLGEGLKRRPNANPRPGKGPRRTSPAAAQPAATNSSAAPHKSQRGYHPPPSHHLPPRLGPRRSGRH